MDKKKQQPKPTDSGGYGRRNGRAISLPKPPLAGCDCKFDSLIQMVKVEIEINESGNVVKAKAVSGHPFLRQLVEQAARFSKFSISYLNGIAQTVYSELIYNFNYSERQVSITESILRFTKEIDSRDSSGIVNGMDSYLPKPEYTEEAKSLCAKGKVEVEVLIDENGKVVEAKAISGDDFLWGVSVKVARMAKFSPINDVRVKVRGILVYNFPEEKNCIYLGQTVNKKAKYLPKPIYPKECHCSGTVKIRVVINMDGNVISASAISGHPLLRFSAVQAARQTKLHLLLLTVHRF